MRHRIYGIGVDVAYIPRFQHCFERYGDRFLKKAFHPEEITEFYRKSTASRPVYLASRLQKAHNSSPHGILFGRWAVKEATYKAFQHYRVLFPEIRLVREPSQDCVDHVLRISKSSVAPQLRFSGTTLDLARTLRIHVRSDSVAFKV